MATLHDIRNDLLTILFQKEYVEESDFNNIRFITNGGESLKQAAIIKALEQLSKSGVVTECIADDKKYWILEKNAAQIIQNIEISAGTANAIYQITKDYANLEGVTIHTDPSNITERDIQLLCVACSSLLEQLEEASEDEDHEEFEEEDDDERKR